MGSRPPNNTQAKKEGLIPVAEGLNVTYGGIPQASKSNWNFKRGPRRSGVTLPLMSQVFGNQQRKTRGALGGGGQPPTGLLTPGVILGALETPPPCTLHTHTHRGVLLSHKEE